MKKLLLLILSCFFFSVAFCQSNGYWQQQVNYKIQATLNDADNTLDGFIQMQYQNNSPDTLNFIWIHLWPNAYKNDRTAFSDQLLENGRTDFYFSDEKDRGYINRLNFKVDNIPAGLEDHPEHQDIVKLLLPTPLVPGNKIDIETAFHVKLPYNFSRGGHVDNSYQLTQWYPKPAVYDKKGWHEMPYLDQGEFYSELGNYSVSVTMPAGYIVAATGNLQKETKNGNTKILEFYQSNVHDFAWFADKDFIVKQDTMQLPGKVVRINVFHFADEKGIWNNSINDVKNSIRTKDKWIGEYPYDVISVVENSAKTTGGMEYPTITVLKSGGSAAGLERVINHEVGHNWFCEALATNERQFPWMDEGMNTYYDRRYAAAFYDAKAGSMFMPKEKFLNDRFPAYPEKMVLQTMIAIQKDQPINTSSEKFSKLNYGLVAYEKTGEWMKMLEDKLGKETFDKVMQTYYDRWKFKHPYPEDFKATAEEVSGQNLNEAFALLNKKGDVEKPQHKSLKLASFFNFKETDKYNYISVAPAIGVNYYDKLMLGVFIHNYSLPPTKFQFFAAPLYATGSKELNGIGRVGYTFYPGNNGQKFELALAGEKFTTDSYTDSTGKINYMPFNKITPSLKYTFANKDPRSSVTKYIQWKTFFINETSLLFTTDTVQHIDVITYPVKHRYVNQLRFVLDNDRVLYPYNAALQLEQGKGFARAAFTGNYYFNYPKAGGLNVRVFAGKFFYLGDKTFVKQFETDAYHLNMSGPKGYEDYTYSNYFVGRNEFDGFSSQQIMIRDGAFKVHTDFLNNKIGKTDDWLTAVNFTSDIPKQINPLALLPFKLPLKVFADFGTYSEPWKLNPPTGKLLYDAGVQLSLFDNVLNIYVPIFYSKVYDNYFKSVITEKRFLKNITFSIDVQNISFKKLVTQIGL
ncbi:MAG: M1 family metallopeptidase [Ferruginibacter sp.]